MARIRNIKPEFFKHEELQDLQIEHPKAMPMFVFAGLWTQCEYTGVFAWKPRSLKLEIFPFIEYDIEESLYLLESNGFITHFQKDGKKYGVVINFKKYQAISKKESEQELHYPVPTKEDLEPSRNSSGTIPEPSRNHPDHIPEPQDLGLRTYDLGHMTKDIGEVSDETHTPEKKSSVEKSTRFKPPEVEEVAAYCKERNNKVDPSRFIDFYASKGWMVGKNKMKDWRAAVRNWEQGEFRKQSPPDKSLPDSQHGPILMPQRVIGA